LVDAVKATGSLGIIGVFIPKDPGAADKRMHTLDELAGICELEQRLDGLVAGRRVVGEYRRGQDQAEQ
jgi:hypothetical protein